MKLKFYTMLAVSMLACGTMLADDNDWLTTTDAYHGFRIKASQALLDSPAKVELATIDVDETDPTYAEKKAAAQAEYDAAYAKYKTVWNVGKSLALQVLFQPEYRPIMVDYDSTTQTFTLNNKQTPTTVSILYTAKGATNGIVDYAAPWPVGTTEYLPETSFAEGTLNGQVLTAEMGDDGLAYVTCPDQYYNNKELTTVAGGDIRVRFCTLSSDSGRLGDNAECHVSDITGVSVTISAPTTVTVETHYTQASSGAFSSGSPDKDALGKVQRTGIIALGSTTADNTPQDLVVNTAGKDASNSFNVFTFKRTNKDTYGYPLRYVDIVFKGVKAGEKVGWTNYQSLHDGYTPVAYQATTGIANIGVDTDNNAPVEYFNLQGVRVDNPTTGLYIQRQGSKATKVLVK